MQQDRETITAEGLDRIFIRVQDEQGHWITVNCLEATDTQFDSWIRTRIQIEGSNEPWPMQERADVCNVLWQQGGLTMLKKDVKFEETS